MALPKLGHLGLKLLLSSFTALSVFLLHQRNMPEKIYVSHDLLEIDQKARDRS